MADPASAVMLAHGFSVDLMGLATAQVDRGRTAIERLLWKRQLEPGPAPCHIASMAGYVVIRITERLGGGEPLRTAYAVAEPNQHRAIALFKLRPDHTADEQVEAVVELSQSALDSLGLKPGMIKPL
jgi:hypothetical protein